MSELEVTVQNARLLPGAEPCEVCGTSLVCVDVADLVRAFAGLPSSTEKWPTWMEQHMVRPAGPADTGALQMRPHSRERCARVRAGDAEPWEPMDPLPGEDGEAHA